MDRKIFGTGGEVTVFVSDHQTGSPAVIMGINGKSQNPDRHAVTLTPGEARKLAVLLNAFAELA